MAEITTSFEPGHYTTGITLTVSFPPDTRKAIVTRTNRAPVLSEILAYDRGPITPIPPGDPAGPDIDRPFLAVTQDGRGNVIFDGGFPKFYNLQIRENNGGVYPPTIPDTWDELTPHQKYLFNGLNFCANRSKTLQGNRKVLFIGNAILGDAYVITDSHYNPVPGQLYPSGDYGFKDTIYGICNAGNWEPTFYTPEPGDKINLMFSELDKYVAVVFFASYGELELGETRVTDTFCKELAVYRNAGNGIAVITDHCGDNYTDLADALARGTVFGTDATRVTKEYGCYFSGNVDRVPMLVSEIKRQIGFPGPPESHPLLNNLADTDYIFAGDSESIVMPELYTNEQVDPNSDLIIDMTTPGNYRVNVLVQLEDGSIITRPMLYTTVDPSEIFIKDTLGRSVTNSSETYKPGLDYATVYAAEPELTLMGEVLLNGVIQGYFKVVDGVMIYQLFVGPDNPILVKNGDSVKYLIKEPFEYGTTIIVNIPDPVSYYEKSGTVSQWLGKIKTHPYFSGISDIGEILLDIQSFSDKQYNLAKELGVTLTDYHWNIMGKVRLPFTNSSLLPCNLAIYTNPLDRNANQLAFADSGNAAIIANTNEVYYWDNLPKVWIAHPQSASELFGLNRQVIDSRTGTIWTINLNNTTVNT